MYKFNISVKHMKSMPILFVGLVSSSDWVVMTNVELIRGIWESPLVFAVHCSRKNCLIVFIKFILFTFEKPHIIISVDFYLCLTSKSKSKQKGEQNISRSFAPSVDAWTLWRSSRTEMPTSWEGLLWARIKSYIS